MKKIFLYFPLLFLLSFFSCDDEPIDGEILSGINNGGNDSNESFLYDKWWYDSNDFAADIYFHSNGIYEQRVILLGQELTSNGDWFWLDEENGIMKIENLEGEAQALNEVWFKITDIQENSINVQQSTDGNTYSIVVVYLDTNN